MASIGTGALGLIWLLAWWMLYRCPYRGISGEELAYIRSDPPEVDSPKVPLRNLIDHRQTWAIALGRLFTSRLVRLLISGFPTS